MNMRAPTKLAPTKVTYACGLIDSGSSMTNAATLLGVHRSTLYRALRQDAIDHILRLGADRSNAPKSPTRRRAMLLELRRESRLANRTDSLDAGLTVFMDAALDDIAQEQE